MTYLIETYGCQMNKAESAALEILFREREWVPAVGDFPPDLVLINTCSVRITAETRAWGRIDHWAAEKARRSREGKVPLALVVTGCMAERMKKGIRDRQPRVDYVIGTFQKQAFGLVLDAVAKGLPLDDIDESPAFIFAKSYYEPSSFRAFLPIMHGCNNFCTYCIVPHIRGREVSRKPGDILAELDALEAQGVREVTLLGQNVNSYRWPADGDGNGRGEEGGNEDSIGTGDLDFPGLLRLIAERTRSRRDSGIRWMRFMTSHPKDLSDELIRVIAEEPLFCHHIHLPVQAGSDPVLKAMNRRYRREEYLALVDRLRAALPDISLSTDLLVGFPGESEKDLEATLDLMRRVGYTYAFMYHFNPREGTPAAAMGAKVSEKEKRARLARVIELQKTISAGLMAARIGSVEEVLVEDLSRRRKSEVLARTARDEMVVFEGGSDRIGTFAHVRLLSLSGNTFRAEEVAAS
jgi:tRNA-2-methylthio-N6-dimethylallyladenosine synthase